MTLDDATMDTLDKAEDAMIEALDDHGKSPELREEITKRLARALAHTVEDYSPPEEEPHLRLIVRSWFRESED